MKWWKKIQAHLIWKALESNQIDTVMKRIKSHPGWLKEQGEPEDEALRWAVKNDKMEALKALITIEKEEATKKKREWGEEVLIEAIDQKKEKAALMLIDAGCSVKGLKRPMGSLVGSLVFNDQYKTALHLAVQRKELKVMQALIQRKEEIPYEHHGGSIIIEALRTEEEKIVREWLDHGMLDQEELKGEKEKGLLYAAREMNWKWVEFFIKEKTTINTVGRQGTTPLMEAVKSGDRESVGGLLKNGACCFQKDYSDETAIEKAIEYNRLDILMDLIQVVKKSPSMTIHKYSRWIKKARKHGCEDSLNRLYSEKEALILNETLARGRASSEEKQENEEPQERIIKVRRL